MATSSELIQLRNRLIQVVGAHDDSQGRITLNKLQGIGVTQVPGLQYFTLGEVEDLLMKGYLKKSKEIRITPISNEISQPPGQNQIGNQN
jgi:hypothetical protein